MINDDSFVPSSLNIRDVFCNDNVAYKIPDFQRRYSWGRDQLDALWNDLYESYQNHFNDSYFLGSIVVVKNQNNIYEIIDGQQRLTTLVIMTSVLLKTYPEISCPNPEKPEDDTSLIDAQTLEQCLYFRKGRRRLTLQTAPEYDSDFNSTIIIPDSFAALSCPTKYEMKKDNPVYNFRYAAYFFYNQFNKLSEEDRLRFVFFIYNKVKLIRIVCNNLSFAIKLFQVMNDRGLPLASSDIIKSYIMGRIEEESDKDELRPIFSSNWKNLELIVNNLDLRMDDFMVCYEYYKLKSNPKRQIVDELKVVIDNKDIPIKDIIDELNAYASALNEVFSSDDPIIYSLRYIPWTTYVRTVLASAHYVNYGLKILDNDKNRIDISEQQELFVTVRRYFYLAFISGKTLNQIKSTFFNLLSMIIDKKPLIDIKTLLNESIGRYKMIKETYEALNDDVYGEDFLKPLMLSIEYDNREVTNKSFIKIDKELHIDHIIPQKFSSNPEWNYLDKEEVEKYMNTLGNMALLYYKKNEEALNKGFIAKCNIYQGKNSEGTQNNSGITSFDTTREIVEVLSEGRNWDVDDIKRRAGKQMSRIEKLLNINTNMIEKGESQVNTNENFYDRAARFNFHDLGIANGETLTWYNDPTVTCEVIDEHNVFFNGERTTLSGIARNKLGYNINGAICFKYKGKTISSIREDKEKAEK